MAENKVLLISDSLGRNFASCQGVSVLKFPGACFQPNSRKCLDLLIEWTRLKEYTTIVIFAGRNPPGSNDSVFLTLPTSTVALFGVCSEN